MPKLLRILTATSVLFGATSAALADVITFDALDPDYSAYAPSLPLLTHLDAVVEGSYVVGMDAGKSGAQGGSDLVGAIVDGIDNAMCFDVICPANNPTNYLAALNDGVPYVYRLDGGKFNFTQFDASFIAAGGVDVLPTALLLRVLGYNGNTQVALQDIYLPGPDSDGGYSFSTYAMSVAFATTALTEVDFLGYACTTSTNCTRSVNQAQYGLDNLVLTAPVPEPSTWALLGLGLGALGMARRRRATAA